MTTEAEYYPAYFTGENAFILNWPPTIKSDRRNSHGIDLVEEE